jgi:hypothetical protein
MRGIDACHELSHKLPSMQKVVKYKDPDIHSQGELAAHEAPREDPMA